jgi:hypothetical protein
MTSAIVAASLKAGMTVAALVGNPFVGFVKEAELVAQPVPNTLPQKTKVSLGQKAVEHQR